MNKAFLLFLFGIVLCIPAHGQFAAVSRGPLSGNCNPHTLGIDYLANNVYSCDGSPAQWKLVGAAAVLTPSGTKAIPNCNAAGTVVNQTVQESSQTVNGVTTTCATVGAIGSTSVIGVCSVLGVCGTLGTAIVGTANTMPCIFDNSATVGDYVAPSSSVTGFCSDIGSTKPTSAEEILGNVYQANGGGGGTIGYVEVAPLSLLLPGSNGSGGGGAGSINNCATVGAIAYYSGLNIISCDLQFTTNGIGTFTAVGGIFTGAGAGFIAQVQGTAPSLSLSNAVYLFPPTRVGTTYGLSWPGSLPTNGDCVKFGVSGSVAQFLDAGASCGSGSGSVTSLTATAPIVVTPSPITTTGVISANTQGTDSKLLTSGTVSGTGSALCTDANGGATTSGCTPGATFQVNGTNTTSQTTINYQSGTGITVSNPSAGNVLIAEQGTSQVSTPSAPTVTPQGTTGSASYSYVIVACEDLFGQNCLYNTPASTAGSTSTGNATLSSSNSNLLSGYGDTLYGANCFNIYRTVGGATQGLIQKCAGKRFIDTGLAGDGTTAPTVNNTRLIPSTSYLPGCNIGLDYLTGPDAPPCPPSAFDTEMRDIVTPGGINDGFWKWGNQGSATATPTNGTIILTTDTAQSYEYLTHYLALPSTPYTFEIWVAANAVNIGNTNGNICFLGLRESGTSKITSIELTATQAVGSTAAGGGWLWLVRNSTSNTPGSALRFQAYNNSTAYMKIQNDGTNLKYFFSPTGDGLNFLQWDSQTITTAFTTAPNQLIIGGAGNGSQATTCTFDFERRTQ